MANWGNFFGKIADQFQGRVERLKNEKAKLEQEKKTLEGKNYDINNKDDRKKMARCSTIIERIAVINKLLENAAKD